MKKNAVLFSMLLLLSSYKTYAQLYIGGGPNLFNLTSGDINKDQLKGTFGASAGIGYVIKQKYYVGFSIQSYSFFVDERKITLEPGYYAVSDNIIFANAALFADVGYRYVLGNRSSLLGTVGIGNYLLAKASYEVIDQNTSHRLNINSTTYTGTSFRVRASYLYNFGRNFGAWAGVSYMQGNGKSTSSNSTDENKLQTFSGHIGIFFSFFNKGYKKRTADIPEERYPGME